MSSPSFPSHDGTEFRSDQRQTERKKSGLRVGGQNPIGNSVGVCAKISATEKHRTEVTEATEGEFGFGGQEGD